MIETIISLALLFFALCAVGVPQTGPAGQQGGTSQDLGKPPEQEPFFIFREVAPTLRRQSRVPLRLPGFLPDVDEKRPIYAMVQSASSSSYDILLAVVMPCEGQNNCLYGSLQGSVSPFESSEGKIIPVKLRGRINGQFIESVCHAYCSQAYVRWSEHGFYYSIGIKAGEMDTLLEVANSAIKPVPITEELGIFYEVRPLLLKRTTVPLRLPTYFPRIEDETLLYADLISANRSGYEIVLGFVPDCSGGNACRYGTVMGSSQRLEDPEGVRVPVKLVRGIKGYFIDAQCYAFCDDSVIGWEENGYHYSIGIKAEKMELLIEAANSAIKTGHESSH